MPSTRPISHARRRWLLAAVVVTVAAVAACGTSKPPSARDLAAKISGCTHITARTPAVMELQDVTCSHGGTPVEIGTFANAHQEHRWIADGGSPMSPDPDYAGCCVQGDLWAATVDFNKLKAESGYYFALDPTAVMFAEIEDALGGSQVNSPAVYH